MNKGHAVFYAVDDTPQYVCFAQKSIETIRQFDGHTPIVLFVFGDIKPPLERFARRLRVTVKPMPRQAKELGTFLKWLALAEMHEYPTVLFADADTAFFESPASLFSKYRARDFYAREEICTSATEPYTFILGEVQKNQMNQPELSRVAKKVGARALPIFNTGLMVFNRSSHVRAVSALPLIETLRQKFKSGEWAYPSTNLRIADEVCMSLAFGTLPDFAWGLLTRKDAPWYAEWKGRDVDSPGLVIHTWTHFYVGFCHDFFGERGLKQLRSRVQALSAS